MCMNSPNWWLGSKSVGYWSKYPIGLNLTTWLYFSALSRALLVLYLQNNIRTDIQVHAWLYARYCTVRYMNKNSQSTYMCSYWSKLIGSHDPTCRVLICADVLLGIMVLWYINACTSTCINVWVRHSTDHLVVPAWYAQWCMLRRAMVALGHAKVR